MENLSKIDAIVCQCKNEKELKDLLALSKKVNVKWCSGRMINIHDDTVMCSRQNKDTLIFFYKSSENSLEISYANKINLKNGFHSMYGLKCFVLNFKMFEKVLYHYYIKTKKHDKISMSMS